MDKIRRKVPIQIDMKKENLNKRLKRHINYRRRKFVLDKYLGKIKFFPKDIELESEN